MDELIAYQADGPGGQLFTGHRVAGTFGRWRLVARSRSRWELTAERVDLDAYYAFHGGALRVRLDLGVPGCWEGGAELLGAAPFRLRGAGVLAVGE